MNVSLEVGSSSQLLCQQLEPGKDHQVPSLGTAEQLCWGLLQLFRRERLVGNFLSITKWILVEILAVLLWLDLKTGGTNENVGCFACRAVTCALCAEMGSFRATSLFWSCGTP